MSGKPEKDLLDTLPKNVSPRGKAIAAARERGESNWKKVFRKLDAAKPKKGKR